ncbi:MAG: DUF29 domain-containing protein [Microcystaceae cyanobacterium]
MLTDTPLTYLYESDYHLWLSEMIQLLKNRQFDNLDYTNLCEELESLGRSEKRAVESLLEQILIHLLLYQYWITEREYNANHWRAEIIAFRNQINRYLNSKTLKNHLESRLPKLYQDALRVAKAKSRLTTFPLDCPYTFEQALEADYFPKI